MTKISIDNFRSFKDQDLVFSKINILIGENSSGKSSFLKFLLALKQTMQYKFSNLKLHGEYTDLGNYHDVVYYHNSSEKIKFSFEFGSEYSDYYFNFIGKIIKEDSKRPKFIEEVKELISDGVNSKTSCQVIIQDDLDKHSNIEINFANKTIGTLQIKHSNGVSDDNIELDSLLGSPLKCSLIFNDYKSEHIFDDIDYQPDGFLSIIVSSSLRQKCDETGDKSIFYKISYLLVLQNYITEYFRKIRFVNPFHANPQRFHYIRDKENSNIASLENFMNIIGDKKIPESLKGILLNNLNEALRCFGLADAIEVIRSEQNPIVEIKVKIVDLSSNITDVGYGVSLQIPVLFQAIMSQLLNGETLLIEQPEIHLHPKLQANFIDTLIKYGQKNTYFIETHSEHIIRKLQVLVKNREYNLKPEDVSIHYFRKEDKKFVVTSHKINDMGKLEPNFPTGFYDTSYTLARQLL